jgi:hypothetical protein
MRLGRSRARRRTAKGWDTRRHPFTKEKSYLSSPGTYPFPLRYICVPQTGQVPRVAGFPFFMVT